MLGHQFGPSSVPSMSSTEICQLPKLTNIFAWGCRRILSEDREMVEKVLPEHLLTEMSVKADLPQTAFRKKRQVRI